MATPILGLTELVFGQQNGHTTFNEVLQQLEAYSAQTPLEDLNAASPPGSPSEGDLYTVGTPANWTGTPVLYDIAQYYNGVWAYYTPIEGMTKWDKDSSARYYWSGSAWTAV